MVQALSSKKSTGTPSSAVATRLADFVRPPEQLATQLTNYAKGTPYI